MVRQAQMWEAEGGPSRDLSVYTAWRDRVDPEVLESIGLYAAFLQGQNAGMTDALDLVAARCAAEMMGIGVDEQPGAIVKLVTIHSIVRERSKNG